MDKKKLARMEMLKALSKKKGGELHSDKGEKLKAKRLSKVTVVAPDEKSLEKGLSKAQQILKAKLGEKLGLEDKGEEEACDYCESEGCEHCEGDAEVEE
jgi:hypothetical protein